MHDVNDRACGLMTGIAAGNLLGDEVEGWPRERIAAAYPQGVREIDPRRTRPLRQRWKRVRVWTVRRGG